MQDDLIDRIYEASFIPENWPGILDDLAGMTEAKGGLLFSARDKVLSWTTSDNLEDVFHTYVKDGWFARCDRRVCIMGKAHDSFLIENDYWSPEEFEANPIYQNFFRPRGLGCSAGTGLLLPTGDRIVFSVERTLDRGPMEKPFVERLNELRPHLARSALIAARLGLKSATGASEALTKLGLPTILLDADGAAVEMSNISEDVAAHLVIGAQNKVGLKDKQANDLFSKSLQTLHLHSDTNVNSFPLRAGDTQAAMVAHILPISRSAHDMFAKSYAILVLTPVAKKSVPPVELVRSLFDLTASEARVARKLAAGKSVEEIAEDGGVALSTVRTQLRQVMEKTGCSRQAEVVALLANLALQK
ncbi:helix-turn-helix transcriptional regulator [Litorimonas haliclonae]|uniref:helix-turn-helix transcriptional regulator n=1 Tax=Litorimonas haliclonae TaxID=2081977 RepID=UPI0039F13799